MNDNSNNSKVCAGIAAIIGAATLGVVALVAVFLPEQLPAAGWMVGSLCFMGVALGYLATKSRP